MTGWDDLDDKDRSRLGLHKVRRIGKLVVVVVRSISILL